jgi:hypothetical protein
LPRVTNEAFVADLMQRSPHGDLCQTFILEAIRFYADIISKTTPVDNPRSIVSEIAWHGIAVDLKERLEARYVSEQNYYVTNAVRP